MQMSYKFNPDINIIYKKLAREKLYNIAMLQLCNVYMFLLQV